MKQGLLWDPIVAAWLSVLVACAGLAVITVHNTDEASAVVIDLSPVLGDATTQTLQTTCSKTGGTLRVTLSQAGSVAYVCERERE